MAKDAVSSTTAGSLSKLLQEAGVPEANIPSLIGTRRVTVDVPAAYFPMDYLRETADQPFQMALIRLVIEGRLRVQDPDDGLLFFEGSTGC